MKEEKTMMMMIDHKDKNNYDRDGGTKGNTRAYTFMFDEGGRQDDVWTRI